MNKKGELSNKMETIIAIDFDAIFNRKYSLWEFLTKNKLERSFNKEFKSLTYTLYHNLGFNIYIVSANKDISSLEDTLWGKYVFFNQIKTYEDAKDLAFDCRHIFKYYIGVTPKSYLLENSYTLQEFKELM